MPMSKTVKMRVYFPGMMSGEVLPRQGECVTLSDVDAATLVERGLADYCEKAAAPVEVRVVEPAETATEKRGPGRPKKSEE